MMSAKIPPNVNISIKYLGRILMRFLFALRWAKLYADVEKLSI